MKLNFLKTAILGLAFCVSGLANAGLIVNGDFATNDTSGWSKVGDATYWNADSGYFETFDNSGFSGLTQSVIPSSQYLYTLSFDTFASQVSGNTGQFSVNGDFFSFAATTTWITTTFDFTGTNLTTEIGFYFSTVGGSGTWKLDNVLLSRELTGPVNDVPEPSTLAIFALGIMGFASRRFAKK